MNPGTTSPLRHGLPAGKSLPSPFRHGLPCSSPLILPSLKGFGGRPRIVSGGVPLKKKAATYSPALRRSTIGAPGLNFSVRDGKRWNTGAKAT